MKYRTSASMKKTKIQAQKQSCLLNYFLPYPKPEDDKKKHPKTQTTQTQETKTFLQWCLFCFFVVHLFKQKN